MATVVKLPVGDTVARSFRAPFKFFWPLAPFYLVLQLGVVGVLGAFATVSGKPGSDEAGLAMQSANIPLAVIAGIVLFVASVMLVVLTHRLIAGAAEPWRLAGPVLGYIMLTVGLALIVALVVGFMFGMFAVMRFANEGGVSSGAAILAILGMLAAYIALAVFFVRAMLALPAAALERPSPLRVGWQASRGNWWRLFAGFWLLSILTAIVSLSLTIAGVLVGVVPWPPVDPGAQGLANGIDYSDPTSLVMLSINLVVNYFVSVATTAFLTFSLIALWRNVEIAE